MRMAGIATMVYGLLTGAGGLYDYFRTGQIVSAAAALLACVVLLVCGFRIRNGQMAAGFAAGVIAMVLGLFFGYRFIASGLFLPNGAVLVTSFLALFLILIGMFMTLASRESG